MKVLIQHFTKGEFGEQIFSAPTVHTAGEQALYALIKKAVSKKIDATCFVYLEDNALQQVYYKVWKDSGKLTMQRCVKVAGKAEVAGKTVRTTIKQIVADVYNLYWLIPEDRRGEENDVVRN